MNIKKIAISLVMFGLVAIACFSYYIYSIMLVSNTAFNGKEAYVFVSTGASYREVRLDLEPLLKNIEKFDILARQKKYTTNVKPGRYRIANGMTNNDIINSIRSQNIPIKITFNNQHSLEVLAKRISNQIEPDSLSLIQAFTDEEFLKDHGFTSETALAMYLPNSYEFFWNTSPEKFRAKMLKSYRNFWNIKRQDKAKNMGLSPTEVAILAAIVQEESKQKSEQKRVAGVYVNRLKNGWPLQADPTLKFAAYKLPEYKNKTIKRILNKHKAIKSPYNTYLYKGLPPGLIAMPDLVAIDAVLNYEQHKFFYFAADRNRPGFHKFAESLSDHNKNARSYHNYLNEKGVKN